MKLILLSLLLTVNTFAAFTPFPPVVTPPDVLVTKGSLLTSTGSAQVEQAACADGEVIVWDATEANGFKCDVSAGGVGGVNYITNSDMKTNISGYATYADAAGLNPVDGTGGTANVLISQDTTSKLEGVNSLKLVVDAANRQGEGFSYDFTIDAGMKAQKLTGSFWYDTSAANYADDDIRISIYDVTNSKLIRANGEDLKGGQGVHYFQFQTAGDSVNYRLIFHVSSTNTLGYSIYFDQVVVGPKSVASGQYVSTQELSFGDAASSMTVSSGFLRYGTVSGSGDEILSYDDSTGRFTALKDCEVTTSLTAYSSTSVQTISLYKNATLSARQQQYNSGYEGNASMSVLLSRGDYIAHNLLAAASGTVYMTMSAVAVSPNAKMSEDLGGREIVVRAKGNGGESLTNGQPIVWSNIQEDTVGSWDGSVFTAKESGYFDVAASSRATTQHNNAIYILTNTGILQAHYEIGSSDITTIQAIGIYLAKGDTFSIVYSAALTLLSDTSYHWLNIAKRASPQTMLETETVAARYTSDSGQGLTGGLYNVVIYEDIVRDTHGAFNSTTGIYTVPISGWYTIGFGFEFSASISAASQYASGFIFVDGSTVSQDKRVGSGSLSDFGITSTIPAIYLSKGQQVYIVQHCEAGTSMSANSAVNFFSIARIK